MYKYNNTLYTSSFNLFYVYPIVLPVVCPSVSAEKAPWVYIIYPEREKQKKKP